MKYSSRITNKKHALIAALQSGAAYDYAVAKSRRQFRRPKSEKQAYKPGSLGPSAVATAVKEEFHGLILSRRERKELVKASRAPVKKFYSQG